MTLKDGLVGLCLCYAPNMIVPISVCFRIDLHHHQLLNGIQEGTSTWLNGAVIERVVLVPTSIVIGPEKQVWCKCKAYLQFFYPNWKRRD